MPVALQIDGAAEARDPGADRDGDSAGDSGGYGGLEESPDVVGRHGGSSAFAGMGKGGRLGRA